MSEEAAGRAPEPSRAAEPVLAPLDVRDHMLTRAGASWQVRSDLELSPGRLMRALRWELRLTQPEVAALAGIDQSHLSRLERGKDGLFETWRRIAASMGATLHLGLVFKESIDELIERRIRDRRERWWRLGEERRARRLKRLGPCAPGISCAGAGDYQ